MNQVKEFIEALLWCALMVGLFVAFCWGTPPQRSGEADLAAHEIEIAEGGAK